MNRHERPCTSSKKRTLPVPRTVPEFFSCFDAEGDALWLIAGMLSGASRARLQASLARVATEFEQLAHQDARLPLAERDGYTAILGFRSWEYPVFAKLRRMPRGHRAPAQLRKSLR